MRPTIFDIMDLVYPGIAIYKIYGMSYEEALKRYLEKRNNKEEEEKKGE